MSPSTQDQNGKGTGQRLPALLRRITWVAVFGWTLAVGFSLVYTIKGDVAHTIEMARKEARANFLKDQAFRYWATRHGGVYVTPDERTPPNPYLKHIPDRDVVTTEGKKLTLMNPAYIMRQVMGEFEALYGVKGHITSLNLLNPNNAPDPWEHKALLAFEKGVDEVFEVAEIDGKKYMRLMRPLVTKKGCLKCHAQQGYKVGDVRGGVSIAVPMAPHYEMQHQHEAGLAAIHGAMWLVGLLAIALYSRHSGMQIKEIDRSREALTESEGQLHSVVETAGSVITVLSPKQEILQFNREAERVFGVKASDVIGKNFLNLFVPEEHHAAIRADVKKVLGGRPARGVENRVSIKGGESCILRWNVDRILGSDGEPIGVVSIGTDVTELRRAEDNLKRTIDELSKANSELERFAFIASHDLREPIRNVVTYTQMFERKHLDSLDEEGREILKVVVDGAKHMDDLVRDLLSYSAIASGGESFTVFGAEVALSAAEETLHDAIRASQAKITHEKLPKIKAEVSQITQLFHCLLSNALKFASPGKPPEVHISAEKKENLWVFSMADKGIGFEPQYHDKVFTVFTRLHRVEDYPGTGIGLAICKRVVERHGGTIWAESTPGQGTTFHFTLPTV